MEAMQFRLFEFERLYITENDSLETLNSSTQMINLSDVKGYYKFNFPKFPKAGKDLTYIQTYQQDGYVANMPYETFRGLHTEYLLDVGLLDNRTMKNE